MSLGFSCCSDLDMCLSTAERSGFLHMAVGAFRAF